MDCQHKNILGPYYLIEGEWDDSIYRDLINLKSMPVWVCADCGLVTAKKPEEQ